ncbi:MAG: RNA pseudouridine synthase [Planctomycetota bacterium]
MRLRVVYEDNHLLVVSKPAGVATMGAAVGEPTVLDFAKDHVRRTRNKPGNVYLGVVSRLDAPVTGVLLFARTSKAAARLTAAFGSRAVEKHYLATVVGEPPAESGGLAHHLAKDDRNARVYTTHADAPGAKLAELSYRVLHSAGGRALLHVRPRTGRKHQIRVQLAKAIGPIVGDAKYGGSPTPGPSIALHAWRLGLEHPVRREPLTLTDPPATGWAGWDAALLPGVLAGAS